jgi:hypothetical protein
MVGLIGLVAALGPPPVGAATISYVPPAGGNWSTASNWSLGRCPTSNDDVRILVSGNAPKAVYYDWTGTSAFNSLKIDGDTNYYGALWHLGHSLMTDYMYIGDAGEGWEWMESDAFLWVTEILYVGYEDPGPGQFYLNVEDYGVLVGGDSYVGYHGPGDFDHRNGYHQCEHLIVGQNAPGTYKLQGSLSTSTLTTTYYAVIGNGDVGTFEQTGGTFDEQGSSGLQLGLNSGGSGTYLMKGGVLNADHISIAWNGDGYFTQTGGIVSTTGSVNVGCQGTHAYRAWYKISDTDGDPQLSIGGDLLIGPQTLAKYEQNSGGTVEVAGDLEIWKGTTDPYQSSYFYMGTTADWFSAANVINHTGYYDQDGGAMSTASFTNDSTQGVNLDNNADCRANAFTNNAGTVTMWRNAILRGKYAGGGNYFICNFTNNATFQMGSASTNGGSFRGLLTNNGTFNYYQGDLVQGRLTNYGTFNINGDFDCLRLVNEATITIPTDRWITATGMGYANAVENNGTLYMSPRAHIDVGTSSTFVNNGDLYAGGSGSDYAHLFGDLENNAYLVPCHPDFTSGHFFVNGDFTASSSAEFHVHIRGLSNNYDHMNVAGAAHVDGLLGVRLAGGFVPVVGDYFWLVGCGARTGQFSDADLPTLPAGRYWRVRYEPNGVKLVVVDQPFDNGDLNCDGLVNFDDINPFVLALSDPAGYPHAYPNCNIMYADCDNNGVVNFDDINPFVAILSDGY